MRKFGKILKTAALTATLVMAGSVVALAGGGGTPPADEAVRIAAWNDYWQAHIDAGVFNVAVVLNGETLRFSVPAFLNGDGRTMVPRAEFFEAVGVAPNSAAVTVIDGVEFVQLRAAAEAAGLSVNFSQRQREAAGSQLSMMTVYVGTMPAYATFTDQLGVEHHVRQNPTRIAVYDAGFLDVLMYIGFGNLGIEKVGVTFDPASPPDWWTYGGDIELIQAGTLFIVDWDALDILQPDLVITQARTFQMNPSGDRHGQPGAGLYHQATYMRYPAPFARLAWSTPSNLVGNLIINAEALVAMFPGHQVEILTAAMNMINEIDAIAAQTGEYRALFVDMTGPNNFTPQFENGRFDQIYCAFGFAAAAPPNSLAGVENNIYARDAWLGEVNPEVIFLFNRGGQTGNPESLARFLSLPGVQSTDAYQNGNIIYNLPNVEWYTNVNGFTSIKRMIYDVNRFLDGR
ncbi:MAG: hypothetical protein FWB74_06365 [Defluviitaleaceae bacterium]|nr:hypothetical protein [Defluviitaleaceae bacterium]